jgi:hypothetical protein
MAHNTKSATDVRRLELDFDWRGGGFQAAEIKLDRDADFLSGKFFGHSP